ncbi:glycoside hydrolase [Pedobacter sp. JY14-1]|uniref:alpha-L-rhamnosidase-related protein n=1 Tax=Pedobacter sp. JY14-1 TaxID=3034151 RepID=UPI0023E25870|nr:glycoside hydrolase [Pedobacter sp. JY14-1]
MLKKIKPSVLSIIWAAILLPAMSKAQDHYTAEQRRAWLDKAEASKPALIETEKRPVRLVKLEADPSAFQGWKTVPAGDMESLYSRSFKQQSGTVVDFGEHLTGYFTFTIKSIRNFSDAPLRFKLTFGEVPAELATPFDPYPGGLSRAWLQDETVTITELPATFTLPRRVAFRYLKIDLLGSSGGFDFVISDMKFKAVSSVSTQPEPLQPGTSALISKIDATGLATLKECMQTVYEDGPKRDRRLWIGDLYLESLANTYSFKNHQLTKRCLYILAALAQQDGFLYASTFETPQLHAQEGQSFLFEYALLYNVALKEYLMATSDRETALDLWPVARRQMDNIARHLDSKGLFQPESAQKEGWWLFVDWRDGLDKQASLQGIMIYTMKETIELARKLGKEQEVATLPPLISKMTAAARTSLYDAKSGLFLSGQSRQVSYASQSWMVLSGVASKAQAQKAMKALATSKNAVKPGTPYLTHYYVAALIQSGLHQEARALVENYWGGMVNKGADTFWEAYDPDNDKLSPYNFFPVNSYCHAWSCTPVYFIRKYPDIFR